MMAKLRIPTTGADDDLLPDEAATLKLEDVATKDDLRNLAANLLTQLRPVPVVVTPQKIAANPALTYTFLDLGGPRQPGLVWNVLSYGALAPDPFSAPAGTMFPFVASVPPADSNVEPLFSQPVDIAVAWANQAAWSGHQLLLHYMEHLILAFKGLANGQVINGFLRAEQYPAALFKAH
jgi:hypothetical protein